MPEQTGTPDEPIRIGPEFIEDDVFDGATAPKAEKAAGANNLLAELEAAVKSDVEFEPLTRPVPLRRGVKVRFDTEIDAEVMDGWRRRATRTRGQKEHFDALKFAAIVVGNQAEQILMRGEEVESASGLPLNFRSREIQEWTGRKNSVEMIRAFYGNDAHLLAACNDVLIEAGYSDDVLDVDDDELEGPTKGS